MRTLPWGDWLVPGKHGLVPNPVSMYMYSNCMTVIEKCVFLYADILRA